MQSSRVGHKYILAVDTSCDDTSVSILADERLLVQVVSFQAKMQSAWGGVVPMLAHREHVGRMQLILLEAIWKARAELLVKSAHADYANLLKELKAEFAERAQQNSEPRPELNEQGKPKDSYKEISARPQLDLSRLASLPKPKLDLLAVTIGPGLAVALEVGIQAVKQLGTAWDLPIAGVNHVEGHLWSGLLRNANGQFFSNYSATTNAVLSEPFANNLGAIFSGNHSEIVRIKGWGDYEILAETLDDAAGEALDKFSVMLGLGYPGGAKLESLAEPILAAGELKKAQTALPLPLAMRTSATPAYSFSGLKTAAMYQLRSHGELKSGDYALFAASYQQAVVDAICFQLKRVLKVQPADYIFTGGGVMANKLLRKTISKSAKEFGVKAVLPGHKFLQDNASMIGLVAYYNSLEGRDIVQVNDAKTSTFLDRKPNLRLTDYLI